jgi:hypothetical protein
VHLLAILKAPVFVLTHPAISEDWLDAKFKLPVINKVEEISKAAQEILRVEKWVIGRQYL